MAYILLFLIFHLILPTYQNTAPKFLHVYSDESVRKPLLINNPELQDSEHQTTTLHRDKRDSTGNFANDNLKNIITKVSKR